MKSGGSLSFFCMFRDPGGTNRRLRRGDNRRIKDPHTMSTWIVIYIYTGWWFQPIWKILVNWDYYSQYMEKKKCSKPPTSIYIYSVQLLYTTIIHHMDPYGRMPTLSSMIHLSWVTYDIPTPYDTTIFHHFSWSKPYFLLLKFFHFWWRSLKDLVFSVLSRQGALVEVVLSRFVALDEVQELLQLLAADPGGRSWVLEDHSCYHLVI